MYQRYVNHKHDDTYERLEEITKEYEQLQNELDELNQMNKNLKFEEKRLVRELNQLKKMNQMIGQRYFVASAQKSYASKEL